MKNDITFSYLSPQKLLKHSRNFSERVLMVLAAKKNIVKFVTPSEQQQIETFCKFRYLDKRGYGATKISKSLRTSINTINNWKYRCKIPFCVKPIERLEKLELLPFKLDINNGRVRTILKVGFFTYGDGHIARAHWKMVNLYGRYEDLEKLQNELRSLGINCRLKEGKGCSTLHIFDFIGRLLIALGFPEGDKVKSATTLPNWLLTGPKRIKKLFLSIFFGNEGGISKDQKISVSINKTASFLKNGIEFMENIKGLCEEFGIDTTEISVEKSWRRKGGEETYSIRFRITERLSIALFYKKLNLHPQVLNNRGWKTSSKISRVPISLSALNEYWLMKRR